MWRELRPDVDARRRRDANQHLGARRVDELRDLRAVEQRVDRHRDAGRLAAPDREMRVGQVRQHERGDVARADAGAREHVRRPDDVGAQLGEGPRMRAVEPAGVEKEGEGGRVGRLRRALVENLQRVGGQRARVQRHAFDLLDVVDVANRHA
ncbi:putative long-chain-fatty-acid--CoA ligase [Burkholderia pseudomallei]|nr:putative long-chain-fatty-acid--CoA ligase [Burkholderia pseudomallei]